MSDLISRQAAIEAIRKLPNAGIHWCVSAESVFDALLKLPSAPQWIPCSERLPDKREEVLAMMDYGDITIADYLGGDDWFTQEGNANSSTEEILAWMPLPQPWGGE